MSEPLTVTWCQSANVGDCLTPWLVKQITGRYPIYADPASQGVRLLGAGSILTWAQKDWVVWGSGIANREDCVNPECDLRLVRGPLSRVRAMQNKAIKSAMVPMGDPGLLVSRFHHVARKDEGIRPYRIGIMPHYMDMQRAWWWWDSIENVHIINAFAPIEEVLDEIAECDILFSSSLHGLVFADSYNIPNVWVRLSDSVLGDGAKFEDYMASVGRRHFHLDWRDERPMVRFSPNFLDELLSACKDTSRKTQIRVAERQEDIWRSCPFVDGVLK